MKYKNMEKRRIIPTLVVFFVVLLFPLFPGILVDWGYEIPPQYGPLYMLIGQLAFPIIIGIYSWCLRKVYLVLMVTIFPLILLFLLYFITFGVLIWTWIYVGICLSLVGIGMVLVSSDKKPGIFIVIIGAILWIMRFFW